MSLKLLFSSAVALSLVLVLAFAPSYPISSPARDGSRAAQLERSLNQALQSFESELERLRLIGACGLRIRPVGAAPFHVDLRSISVRTDADERSGDLQLYLVTGSDQDGLLLLETDSWPAWAAAHSDIQQLRAHCAHHRPHRHG